MKRILISLIFLMLLPKAVLSTAQAPDYLIYEGETHALFSNPLEEYFNENNVRPKDVFSEGCTITTCWRGYIALWEIKGKYLYLLKPNRVGQPDRRNQGPRLAGSQWFAQHDAARLGGDLLCIRAETHLRCEGAAATSSTWIYRP